MKTPELQQIQKMLQEQGYIGDDTIAMSIFLAMKLEKPLLIEGPAGVGKTEISKVMAKALDTDLIRLQCYEGLDSTHALYEWNYQHQLLYLKMQEQRVQDLKALEETIFSDKFLLKRPVLQAITHPKNAVLLIDEVDRADEEFESFLLEVLSDWQVSIPEIGTIKATSKPQIILTGNRTRELSEALRRRCLYLWIDYPSFEKELAIVQTRVPEVDIKLGREICAFMKELRQMKLEKTPGISETIDWARALASLHLTHLDKQLVEDTLGVVLKDWQDLRHTQDALSELLDKTGVTSRIG
ncbi:MoxR family ATPase [Flavobacteriaceae bacterium TP-CH-4]|uniref:MoxR family ATPase n=1 Tax=Pelagihabitans pacificus TaxID=2696054 RepID=A0A967ASZ1_9FLAO|nr:MoxR family ATPase [Pelagihabitans pacificus]NHF59484.1 MoxR family ATPase [Pelagihabitans pacificus]